MRIATNKKKEKKERKFKCNGKVKFEPVLIVVDKVVLKF